MHTRTSVPYDDMIRIIDRLPTKEEYRRVRHLVLQQIDKEEITDDELAKVLPGCPHLESVVLSGVADTTDRTIVLLASTAVNLQGIDLTDCKQVTDVGVLELTAKSLPLHWIQLNGVVGLTDPSISSIAKSCSTLVELELCELPLLTALSVRDVWCFSRKLRTLRLARCPLITDAAFPSHLNSEEGNYTSGTEKPLPPIPVKFLGLPPLVLRHRAENLRVLDISYCSKVTDDAIEGIIQHAPKIQTVILSGCTLLTDKTVESVCQLGDNLDILMMAHVTNITDRSMVRLARSCGNLRSIDVSFCRQLTDMTVFELAGLSGLRRLSLVRVHKLTDNGVFFLAEHAPLLEHLHLSYCDRISLDAVHLLLKKLRKLEYLTVTGVRSFKRKGVERFSEAAPENYDRDQQSVYRVYSGENVIALRLFLDKEEARKRESEIKNVLFVPRSDDYLDLY